MTPAIKLACKAGIAHRIHQYDHDPAAASYGLEAVDKLGLTAAQVFKTLVAELPGGELVVAVLPVAGKLNLKRLAAAAGAKKAVMAKAAAVERSSGYVLGGVSPLAQKKALRSFIDSSAEGLSSVFVSAGRRGLEIELSPVDLQALCRGQFSPLVQEC